MKSTTCCFTGHRILPADKIQGILVRLSAAIDELAAQGVTDFLSGGAIGFDLMAASLVISKREMGLGIRLIFALPCENQDEKWTMEQKRLYRSLLAEADEIRYVSRAYAPDCMKKRNEYMIDHSAVCVSALLHQASGTGQTVRIARRAGLRVIDVMG